MDTTKLSSKGQIILPKSVREGTEFTVEDTADGALLCPRKPFKPTRLKNVAGCLRYERPAKTIEDMDKAVEVELKARHARGRYDLLIRPLITLVL
jgi:bifunctional DNA-binding transcriptional regulator/antitoxin component of YhaV-PrlF toxin-antitoxin module